MLWFDEKSISKYPISTLKAEDIIMTLVISEAVKSSWQRTKAIEKGRDKKSPHSSVDYKLLSIDLAKWKILVLELQFSWTE